MAAHAAVRSATTMSEVELLASAHARIDSLAALHGVNSPQVAAALTRWGRVLDARSTPDDTMALIDALRSTR